MRILSRISLLTAAVTIISATSMAVVAAAPSSHANAEAAQTTSDQSTGQAPQGADRLAKAKLKACQNRQKSINKIMSRIAERGQKQLDLFSTIADRTEAFYTDKGKTLSNYDALAADVTAKKAAAQTEVDAVKATSITFKCDGTDPKGAAASFKQNLKAEIDALKAYKTSVKNLIVGVKSVQGTTSSTDNSQGDQ